MATGIMPFMPAHRKPIVDGKKCCIRCQEWKPLDQFYRRPGRPSGVSRCKKCVKETTDKQAVRAAGRRYRARQLAADPDFDRRLNIRRLYGMSLEEFDGMLKQQGGGCAVCQGPPLGKGQFHVDHCHDSNRIRGLLCHKCNVALGMVQDDIEHLRKLIAYLELT